MPNRPPPLRESLPSTDGNGPDADKRALNRRHALGLTGGTAAAAWVAFAAARGEAPQAPTPVETASSPGAGAADGGYRDSAHVRLYYRLARY